VTQPRTIYSFGLGVSGTFGTPAQECGVSFDAGFGAGPYAASGSVSGGQSGGPHPGIAVGGGLGGGGFVNVHPTGCK
jgi:hypothetical protein